jgi:hypothetical protein
MIKTLLEHSSECPLGVDAVEKGLEWAGER